MKNTITMILLTALVLLSGCANSSNQNANAAVPAQQGSIPANSVTIQNFAFNPSTLTIKAGDTVTWTNQDAANHQIKSATFNSNSLSKGETFQFTFSNKGTYDYSCAIHPSMAGKIIVE